MSRFAVWAHFGAFALSIALTFFSHITYAQIPARGSSASRRPNVILVMTDDQGYGDLGIHGNSKIRTPNLDALARESVRLTDFHVDPTCAETRSALMTGRYATRVGVWHTVMGRSILQEDETTMAEFFRRAGYRTGMFGKWHLGDNYPYRPIDRGFEEVLAHGGGGIGQTPDHWGNDYFGDTFFHNGRPEKQTGYCTDIFFRAALDFISRHRNEPFFCYLATNAPHGPYRVDPSYSDPYVKAGVPPTMARFYGMITNIDENMGHLLEKLREWKLRDNTIVIFMTDNGTAAGLARRGEKGSWRGFNAGMRGKKGSQYEGGHRVPCFWSWPAGSFARDAEVPHLAAHIDILPTLAELCGLPRPDDGHPWDGRSLASLLRNPQATFPQRTLLVHSQRVDRPQKWRKCSVMRGRWRLVDGKELYDLRSDPGQERDIASDHPELVTELRQAYEAWWKELEPEFDQMVEFPLGDRHAPSVTLTAHDWHPLPQTRGLPPWNQTMIAQDPAVNGYWAVHVKGPGRYRVTLRMRPPSVLYRFRTGRATIEFHFQNETVEAAVEVPSGAQQIDFEVDLPAGSARLHSVVEEEGRGARGAYFATIRKLDDLDLGATPALRANDRIVWLGAGLLERMQRLGYTETWLLSRLDARGVTFRNLGWSGDDVWGTARAVFGTQVDGFDRLRRDLVDARPTAVVVQYGANEASDANMSSSTFRAGLLQVVDLVESMGARVILMTPRAREEIGPPLPDPSAYNARLARLCDVQKEIARSHAIPWIDLFSRTGGRLTDDGVHITPFGYWRLGKRIAEALAGPPQPWLIDLDMRTDALEATGCLITALEKSEHGVAWTATDRHLPPPPPPSDAPRNARWLLNLGTLRIRHLPLGHYRLVVDGKPLQEARFDAFAFGRTITARPGEDQAEELRRRIVEKNQLYFHRYRPQNETYLFLFRKHEQGNNAKEVFEFEPLVEKVEQEIERLRRPVAHRWQVVRTRDVRTEP